MTTERERFDSWLSQFRELAPLHGPVLWEAWQAALSAPAVAPEPVAWRYQDARGHYRYRAYKPGFDVEYAILKPVPLYEAHPPRAPLTDGELWSWTRSVMSQAACIQQDYAAGKFSGYEQYSAHLDAAAATRTDELEARISAHGIGGK